MKLREVELVGLLQHQSCPIEVPTGTEVLSFRLKGDSVFLLVREPSFPGFGDRASVGVIVRVHGAGSEVGPSEKLLGQLDNYYWLFYQIYNDLLG